jgi:phosphatidylserine decarboxylase
MTNEAHGLTIRKAEELGWFEMGSTIVLIFEGPQDTQLHIKEGQRLFLGDHIVTTKASVSNQ